MTAQRVGLSSEDNRFRFDNAVCGRGNFQAGKKKVDDASKNTRIRVHGT